MYIYNYIYIYILILKQYLIIEPYIKRHVVVVVCKTELTCDIDV